MSAEPFEYCRMCGHLTADMRLVPSEAAGPSCEDCVRRLSHWILSASPSTRQLVWSDAHAGSPPPFPQGWPHHRQLPPRSFSGGHGEAADRLDVACAFLEMRRLDDALTELGAALSEGDDLTRTVALSLLLEPRLLQPLGFDTLRAQLFPT